MDLETIENHFDNDNKKNINNETNIDTVAYTYNGIAVCVKNFPNVKIKKNETI